MRNFALAAGMALSLTALVPESVCLAETIDAVIKVVDVDHQTFIASRPFNNGLRLDQYYVTPATRFYGIDGHSMSLGLLDPTYNVANHRPDVPVALTVTGYTAEIVQMVPGF